jgi:aspartate/methionine/tyrosine aminotransferase
MNPGDEVLPSPGYPIYESQISSRQGPQTYRYLEARRTFDRLRPEAADHAAHAAARAERSANPTGAECAPAEREALAELVLKHDLFVLCDEAYFDIRYEGRSASFVSLPGMAERCVILYTFSKKFAMTGWRLGAAIGPKPVIDIIAKLNVNDESCSNHFIQYGAIEGLIGDPRGPRQILQTLQERRDAAVDLLNSVKVRCQRPDATFTVPQHHGGHAAQGLRRLRGLPAGAAARNRRLGLLADSFRAAAAGRNRVLHSAGVFRHSPARHPGRVGQIQSVHAELKRRRAGCIPTRNPIS